jgi:geranylgeranyl diphosphate synthase, type II
LTRGDNYQTIYDKQKAKVDRILSQALENREPVSLYGPAYYIIKNGGKRLRPLIVLFACKSVGGKYSDAYNAAVAVELLHNFTLVHDDIMDNASKRRGMHTLHVKYDLNTAVLSGDSLLSVAYEYLLKDVKGGNTRVISEFTKGLVEVCEGQALDKIFEVEKSVSLNDYIRMIRKKTAEMLIMCCRIGGIIGNGSESEIKGLSEFGKNIGIAFQIQDDLLDIKGYEEFGKTTGGDLMEGKKTYLFLRALDKVKGSDKADLERITDNKGISESEVNYYIELYKRIGIVEDAETEIKKYTNKAIKALQNLRKEEDRRIFVWLADSLIKRNK